jgi:uncharacterized protein (TIGR02246 family)
MNEENFAQWLDAYGRAWQEGDSAAIAELFAPEAAYHETPFDPPMIGREAIVAYWREGAELTQRDVTFRYTVLAVTGDLGLNHWIAEFTRVPSGVKVRLDGVMAVRFDADGRCVEFREWWHRLEKRSNE